MTYLKYGNWILLNIHVNQLIFFLSSKIKKYYSLRFTLQIRELHALHRKFYAFTACLQNNYCRELCDRETGREALNSRQR